MKKLQISKKAYSEVWFGNTLTEGETMLMICKSKWVSLILRKIKPERIIYKKIKFKALLVGNMVQNSSIKLDMSTKN